VTFDEFDQFCEVTNWEKPDDERWGAAAGQSVGPPDRRC